MGVYVTPHQAIVGVLRSAGISALGIPDPPQRDFDWTGSPYYEEAKEPQAGFPYVCYRIPANAGPQHTMGDSYPELFDVEVEVVGTNPYIHYIGSPYSDPMVSPIAYLDSISAEPFVFNGVRYICCRFIRKSWEMFEDDTRAPQDDGPAGGVYNNVYIARATYEMEIGATYPTRTRG